MKKLLTVTAVLLTAALFFTGCKNAANSDGGEDLPGKWKSDLNFYPAQNANVERTGGVLTTDGKGTAIFQNTNPTQPDPANPIIERNFRNDIYKFSKENNLTGFEATAKSTSSYCTYGFSFNISNDWKNMYQIILEYDSFEIQKEIDGTWSIIKNWTQNNAIKLEPAENTVTVYKDGNSIVIKVNGTTIHTIENPEITKGSVGYMPSVAYEDIESGTGYTITYKLKQAQYEE